MQKMPIIDTTKIIADDVEMEIINECINRGRLRATKPPKKGDAAYVWRMAAFYLSPNRNHQCFPITAQFYVADIWWESRRSELNTHLGWLNSVADKIVNSVPRNDQYGVNRWSKAFGG
jgi:hypothetical protein